MTANSAPIMLSKSKFFIRITSRMLPAKHIRLFCANAPIEESRNQKSELACLLPGPSVLAAYTPVTAPMIKSARRSTGSTYPLDFCVSYALPSEIPFQEERTSCNTACKSNQRYIRIQVTGCHTQNHTQRTTLRIPARRLP